MNKINSYSKIRSALWFKIIFWGIVIIISLVTIAELAERITLIIFK